MDINTIRLVVWLGAIGSVWLSVRAIIEVMKSPASDNGKALRVAFIVCTPFIGPIVYLLLGGSASDKESLEAKEALLKARLNRNEKAV